MNSKVNEASFQSQQSILRDDVEIQAHQYQFKSRFGQQMQTRSQSPGVPARDYLNGTKPQAPEILNTCRVEQNQTRAIESSKIVT